MVIDSNCQLFYPNNNEYCDQRIFVVTGLMYVNRCRLDIRFSFFDFETDCFPKGGEMLCDLRMLMCAEMSLLEM